MGSLNSTFFTKLLILFIFFVIPAESIAGQETRNGGSGLRTNEGNFQLADLYFQREGEGTVNLGKDIEGGVKSVLDWVSNDLKLDTFKPLHQALFGPLSEYIFVKELPPECSHLVDSEINAPGSSLEHMGCSVGYLTYIIPDKFLELSLNDQILFLIHERLHGIGYHSTYDVKTDIIKAMSVFINKLAPAKNAALKNPMGEIPEILNDNDIAILKKLPIRALQLVFKPENFEIEPPQLHYFKTGALVYLRGVKKIEKMNCKNCLWNANSKLEVDLRVSSEAGKFPIPRSIFTLDLENSKLRNTTISMYPSENFTFTGKNFSLVGGLLTGAYNNFRTRTSILNIENTSMKNFNIGYSWNPSLDLGTENIEGFWDAQISFESFQYNEEFRYQSELIPTEPYAKEIEISTLPPEPNLKMSLLNLKIKRSMLKN